MLHSIEIGKKITLYRKSLHMSEGLLAKLLGVSTQAVSK
jgi:DNA-binding transcriptional regulator YiaG